MMDLGMPKINGIEATAIVKKELPSSKILIFTTAEDDESIFSALKAGADGYCLKTISGELLATAIHSVLKGAAWLDPGIAQKVLRAQTSPAKPSDVNLTQSKLQLLSLVEQGKSVDEIASEMKVNDSLVKGLLNELLGQLKGRPSEDRTATQAAVADQAPITLTPGDVVAHHYRIDERIGEGGMGCVFRASHMHVDRKVAIKTLHEHLAGRKSSLSRFKAEAQASMAIGHPNLVTIYDFGLLGDRVPYLVMEFLVGTDLSDVITDRGGLDHATGTRIIAQVCDALAAVHAKGIVHRDLKPSNIMLVRNDDDPYFVKLVDFGIAKAVDEEREALTRTGEVVGSPPYMSPEQCFGKPLDRRSDLYALGCVMYETYTGRRIYEDCSAIEVMMKHVNEVPSRQPLEGVGLPKNLIDLIMLLLEKKPENRPATASDVRQQLLAC